jgi:hypothetical protein
MKESGMTVLFPRQSLPGIQEDYGMPDSRLVGDLIKDRERIHLVLSDAWMPGTTEPRPGLRLIEQVIERDFGLEDERTFPGDGRIVVRTYRRTVTSERHPGHARS